MAKVWFRLVLALALCAVPAALHAQQSTPPHCASLGLGILLHPVKSGRYCVHEQAAAIPQDQKDHVHFFLINGLDPFYIANLNGIAAYYRSIGFTNTTCYQFPMTSVVRKQIETLRRCDPDARIVVLGYSCGANCARSLANNLCSKGIYVDCLIYLGGDTIFNTPSSKPANVGQIVNITGHGLVFMGYDLFFKGEDIDGAVNVRVDARHLCLPVRTEAVSVIGDALISVATCPSPAAAQSASAVQRMR